MSEKEQETVDVEKKQEETKQEEAGIAIPDDVAVLLEDIHPDAPAGENPEESEDQDTMVAFMTLETEMSKLGGNDYSLCIKHATGLLQDKTKHLRVAVWLMIAWYRTEDLAGFKKGLLLILELLKKYKEALHPKKAPQQAKIIQSLASEGRIKTIEKTNVDSDNAQLFEDIGSVFTQLVDEAHEQYADKPPKLTSLEKIIQEKQAEAKKAKGPSKKSQTDQSAQKKTAPAPDHKPAPQQPAPAAASSAPSQPSDVSAPSPLHIAREKDAAIALKRSLLFYFEESANGSVNRKIPSDASIYGMSRVFRWGKLGAPPNKGNVTQITAPNQPKQAYIDKLVSNKDYNTLIPEIEVNFLGKDEFVYWLDAQRFVVQALENRGDDTAEAAMEIKIQLARLINRIPDLPKHKFQDKKTPFANSETVQWLEDEVQGVLGGGKQQDKILPPVFGEEYEEINRKYEAIAAELPANFEANVKELQDTIAADTRPKGKFLRMLSLANYCHVAKQYKIAAVLFNELNDLIDRYHIREWEQALCVSVWQSMFLNNQKLLKGELPKELTAEIEKKQEELFEVIGKYDCVRALKITNHIQ